MLTENNVTPSGFRFLTNAVFYNNVAPSELDQLPRA
jgi:hypothetical protein